MREIKFRAWDTTMSIMENDVHALDRFAEILSREKYIVMQYTGLKDMNDKEIYEGDVIEFKPYNVYKKWWSSINEIPEIEESCKRQREAFKTERLVVKFEDGCFVLNWVLTLKDVARGQRYKTGSTRHCDTEEKQWDFEVIGNICENPELVSSSEIPTEK